MYFRIKSYEDFKLCMDCLYTVGFETPKKAESRRRLTELQDSHPEQFKLWNTQYNNRRK